MGEDMISNALVWLMHKLTNYLFQRDDAGAASPQARHDRWRQLEHEFHHWFEGLPDSFTGCVRLVPDAQHPVKLRRLFPEIWHSLPACASSMQTYHMGRILLLTSEPPSDTSDTRYNLAGSVDAQIQHHAHEICGISMARPDGSVRVNAIQQLFVAGVHLRKDEERRAVVGFLRQIEYDLGWATRYRVKQLLLQWGWPEND